MLITDMYLAGSHDACAFVAGGSLSLTQDVSLQEQLDMGIRVFDIRLRPVGDGSGQMIAYHGIASQRQELTRDILPVFINFLSTHPYEFVFLSFKSEGDPISGDKESYAEALRKALASPQVAPLIYSSLSPQTTVGDIRGRIVPLHRSSLGTTEYGATFGAWHDDTTFESVIRGNSGVEVPVFIQDNYKISRMDAQDKKADIINAIEAARNFKSPRLNIFYISGTGPFCYPNRAASLLNPVVLSLFEQPVTPVPGIYFLDFCGKGSAPQLISAINQQNQKK